jgi:hypothetical protein
MICPMQMAHLYPQGRIKSETKGVASSRALEGGFFSEGRALTASSFVIRNFSPSPPAPECSSIATCIPDNRPSQRGVLSMELRGRGTRHSGLVIRSRAATETGHRHDGRCRATLFVARMDISARDLAGGVARLLSLLPLMLRVLVSPATLRSPFFTSNDSVLISVPPSLSSFSPRRDQGWLHLTRTRELYQERGEHTRSAGHVRAVPHPVHYCHGRCARKMIPPSSRGI